MNLRRGWISLQRRLPAKGKAVAISHLSEIYMEVTSRVLEP